MQVRRDPPLAFCSQRGFWPRVRAPKIYDRRSLKSGPPIQKSLHQVDILRASQGRAGGDGGAGASCVEPYCHPAGRALTLQPNRPA